MSTKIILIVVALILNLALSAIVIYTRNGTLGNDAVSLAYLFSRGIIYWLRPFLFVALVRFYFTLTNRNFTQNVAIGTYSGAWLILLIGMFYNYY